MISQCHRQSLNDLGAPQESPSLPFNFLSLSLPFRFLLLLGGHASEGKGATVILIPSLLAESDLGKGKGK